MKNKIIQFNQVTNADFNFFFKNALDFTYPELKIKTLTNQTSTYWKLWNGVFNFKILIHYFHPNPTIDTKNIDQEWNHNYLQLKNKTMA